MIGRSCRNSARRFGNAEPFAFISIDKDDETEKFIIFDDLKAINRLKSIYNIWEQQNCRREQQ